MLIEAQMPCDDQVRHVDVLCFSKPDANKAVLPADHRIEESDIQSAVQPVALGAEDGDSSSSEEEHILNENADLEDPRADHLETDSAVQPVAPHGIEIDADSAAQPSDTNSRNLPQASETLNADGSAAAFEEDLNITALEATTSAHDDWLHRGTFLWHMDFHTYIHFTLRKPRPKVHKVSDVDRTEHCFLFDAHYALAASHWQQLITEGHAKLVVMEALRCPLPGLNNGEDNAVFKSLIGTLIKCPGPGHCADPLLCKTGFFQVTVPESSTQTHTNELPDWIDHEHLTPYPCPLRISRRTHADNVPATFSCRLHWKARRAEIELLAKQAASLSHDSKRIPVLADTALLRGFQNHRAARPAHAVPTTVKTPHGHSAAQPVNSPPTWRFLVCFTQVWMQKSGEAFPPFARTVLAYIDKSIHHAHQMSLAQFCAYHLREIIYNLDMLAIARTTKLTATSKEKIENETVEQVHAPGPLGETEFIGGEQIDAIENDDEFAAESWRPEFSLSHARLTAILSRHSEVSAASKKGRKSGAVLQMKAFDDCFHTVLNTPVPASNAKPQRPQLAYAQLPSIAGALLHQDAILKEMRTVQLGGETEVNSETDIGRAVLHNLQLRSRTAEWIDLETTLKGPVHVAKLLIKKLQEDRSKPGKPYKVNAEQLECIALFVAALDKAFAKRPDASKPWLHPAEVLMTILTDGGGGCGKTTLAVEIILPLLEAYYHPEGVLRRAPSNKPARLIGGRTMHSGQGMTPENSMRTAALALNAQSQHKLSITHADAGVLYIDESSMLQAELNHAAALRTTYARESKYSLNRNNYSGPRERYGRIAFLWYSQDHLQLPPVL